MGIDLLSFILNKNFRISCLFSAMQRPPSPTPVLVPRPSTAAARGAGAPHPASGGVAVGDVPLLPDPKLGLGCKLFLFASIQEFRLFTHSSFHFYLFSIDFGTWVHFFGSHPTTQKNKTNSKKMVVDRRFLCLPPPSEGGFLALVGEWEPHLGS